MSDQGEPISVSQENDDVHKSDKGGVFLGSVLNVQPTEVTFRLDTDVDERLALVGEYVLIESGDQAVIGQIAKASVAPGRQVPGVGATVESDLLATYEFEQGNLTPGVLRAPLLGSHVFIAPTEIIQRLVEGRFSASETKERVGIEFAKLATGGEAQLNVSPEKLFGRHCAIVGTSGGGKSWTLSRLVGECASMNSKVIVFDATGEFHTLDERVRHVHLGDDPLPRYGSREIVVPYYHLTEGDLFAIFKPSGQSQAPKLRGAMKALKLARIAPQLAIHGLILKADRPKMQYEREYTENYDEIERPYADFDIRKLTRQIENECVNFQRSPVEPNVWGGVNGNDLSLCVPLINRIQDIVGSKNLAPVFDPGDKPSLFKEINQFLSSPDENVLRISLKYLSFEHNAREIVANAVGRYLLALARKHTFKSKPLVVFLDEAHQFLDASIRDGDTTYKLDNFSLIAKEGRKYALTICLATQRPRDIPEGVLSQVGTMIVHRLINHFDREVVEKATSGLDHGVASSIPALAAGEAVIVGVDFPLPLHVKVLLPKFKPDSKGPDYQKFWL